MPDPQVDPTDADLRAAHRELVIVALGRLGVFIENLVANDASAVFADLPASTAAVLTSSDVIGWVLSQLRVDRDGAAAMFRTITGRGHADVDLNPELAPTLAVVRLSGSGHRPVTFGLLMEGERLRILPGPKVKRAPVDRVRRAVGLGPRNAWDL